MDIEQMNKDLGQGAVFPIGRENTAYAQYFTGEWYLNMLTTAGRREARLGDASWRCSEYPRRSKALAWGCKR